MFLHCCRSNLGLASLGRRLGAGSTAISKSAVAHACRAQEVQQRACHCQTASSKHARAAGRQLTRNPLLDLSNLCQGLACECERSLPCPPNVPALASQALRSPHNCAVTIVSGPGSSVPTTSTAAVKAERRIDSCQQPKASESVEGQQKRQLGRNGAYLS